MENNRKPVDFVARKVTDTALKVLEEKGENENLPSGFLTDLIIVQSVRDHDRVVQQMREISLSGTIYQNGHK